MKRFKRRSSSPGPWTFVFVAGLLLVASFIAPGPRWLYAILGVAVLALGVLTSRSTAELFVSFLATLSPSIAWILRLFSRRREFGEVLSNMDAMLRELKCPTLGRGDLDELAENPPYDAGGDLMACSRIFAARLDGTGVAEPDESFRAKLGGLWAKIKEIFWKKPESNGPPLAAVYELLYRDRYGPETGILWQSMNTEQRWQIARILADSGSLPPLEEGERMAELVHWVLCHLGAEEFSTEAVKRELQAFIDLWLTLSGYAGYLGGVGIQTDPGIDDLRPEVDRETRGGLIAGQLEAVGVEILIRRGRSWISDWLGRQERTDKTPREIDRLARVSVGIYLADYVSAEHLMLAELAPRLVEKPPSESPGVRMLLAHLWARSRPEAKGPLAPPLDELVCNWSEWYEEAKGSMGAGLFGEMYAVLESDLGQGSWPIWLPVPQAVAESVKQSRRMHEDLKGLIERADERQEELRSFLEEVRGKPVSEMKPERLIEEVQSAFSEYLQRMLPPGETGPAPRSPEELRERLESLAREHRRESRLPRELGEFHQALEKMLETQTSFRDHAEHLTRRLDGLSSLLAAEAAGGSAYLITFDQLKGGVANIIDELEDQYGFEHYTRYARIGELRSGESFESFYVRFEADLEERFRAAFATRQLQESEKERFLAELEEISKTPAARSFPAIEPWAYRRVELPPDESFEDFFARAGVDLERQLAEHFPLVAAEQRQALGRRSLEAARIAAVWEQIEVTVQQISLVHRHDFAADAKQGLGRALGRVFSRVFRVPPSSSLVIADLDRYQSPTEAAYGPH